MLFNLFSKLANATNGNRLFVKPKLYLGTLILGMGVTACTNAKKGETGCYFVIDNIVFANNDTASYICYTSKPTVITENGMKTEKELLESPDVMCYVIDPEPQIDCYIIVNIPRDKNAPYEYAQQMPQFPGGEVEMLKFFSKYTKYPAIAFENGIQGTVLVRFAVMKDGSIEQVQVVRSVEKSLDDEAMRVVKLMPKWMPGQQNGENVNVWFTLPVKFKLPQ